MHTKYIWQRITETVWPRFNVDYTKPQVVLGECGAKCQTRRGMPSSCPTEFAQAECASVLVPHGNLDFGETYMHRVHRLITPQAAVVYAELLIQSAVHAAGVKAHI